MAGARGTCARREQDVSALDDLRFAAASDFQSVWIDERRLAATNGHAVACELILNYLPFRLAHIADHQTQVIHLDFPLAPVAILVHVAMAITSEMNDGFADRLGWNGARVQRNAAQELLLALDNEYAPILFGGSNSRLLPGRSASDNDQVVSHIRVS